MEAVRELESADKDKTEYECDQGGGGSGGEDWTRLTPLAGVSMRYGIALPCSPGARLTLSI